MKFFGYMEIIFLVWGFLVAKEVLAPPNAAPFLYDGLTNTSAFFPPYYAPLSPVSIKKGVSETSKAATILDDSASRKVDAPSSVFSKLFLQFTGKSISAAMEEATNKNGGTTNTGGFSTVYPTIPQRTSPDKGISAAIATTTNTNWGAANTGSFSSVYSAIPPWIFPQKSISTATKTAINTNRGAANTGALPSIYSAQPPSIFLNTGISDAKKAEASSDGGASSIFAFPFASPMTPPTIPPEKRITASWNEASISDNKGTTVNAYRTYTSTSNSAPSSVSETNLNRNSSFVTEVSAVVEVYDTIDLDGSNLKVSGDISDDDDLESSGDMIGDGDDVESSGDMSGDGDDVEGSGDMSGDGDDVESSGDMSGDGEEGSSD